MVFRKAHWMLVMTACTIGFLCTQTRAQDTTDTVISYSNGQFQPTELHVPADKAFVLRVKNLDTKAIEFESKSLRVEKVIAAKSEATINMRALKAGRYEFFNEFNEKARGTLMAQ